MSKVIDIQNEVQPHFKEVWKSDKPHIIMKGGRTSFKTSTGFLKATYKMIKMIKKGEKANIVVIRKVASTIRTSVYNNVVWALDLFGVSNQFKMQISPPMIIHKKTGSTFYFYGLDDPAKLKSNKVDDVIAVIYEETAELKNAEEIDQTNITFLRQKHKLVDHVQVLYFYNPPRNPYSWINEWADEKRSDERYLVHESTYLNDELGFVTDDILAEINAIKENDYDYYRYLYLGEAVGLGTNVYNMNLFKALKELPEDDPIILIDTATDTGHQVSATTHGAFALTAKGNVILLDTYYYSPEGKVIKKAPSELSIEFKEWLDEIKKKYNKHVDVMTIDSAEGGLRNQLFKDYGIRIHPVSKGKKVDMIDHAHDLLAQGRFYYLDTPNNQVFVEEHRKYAWDADSLRTEKPKVIEIDDHTCDMFVYYIKDNLRKLKLKH